MDLNFSARVGFARTIASQCHLNLVEEESFQPRTNGNTIYVPRYNPAWSWGSKDATLWWYAFFHEILHNIFKEDFAVLKREKVNMKSRFGFVHNINLDHNIEFGGLGMYDGLDKMLLKGRSVFLEWQLEKQDKIVERDDALDALFAFDTLCRSTWNSTIVCAETMVNDLSDKAMEYMDKLQDFRDEWLTKKDSEEVYDLTKRICNVLGIESQAPKQEEGGEGDASQEESDEEGDKEGSTSTGVVDYMDMLNHSHDENGTDAKAGSTIKIDYSNWDTYGGWKPGPFKFVEPKGPVNIDCRREVSRLHGGEGLANEIRKHLLVMTKAHPQGGHKRGKIDSGKLWKTRVYGVHTDPGKRVFKKDIHKKILDSAVMILVDQSGSMYGSSYYHAVKATSLLTDVLNNLRIPLEIQSFSDDCRSNINFIHKTFSEKKDSTKIIDSFCISNKWMNSNADGDAILNACSSLCSRKEQRKIMIVLSDGMPATYIGQGDIYGWTKKVVADIENNSPIDIYGIGIMDSSVKHIYQHCSVIKSAGDIESTLLEVLKNKVLI